MEERRQRVEADKAEESPGRGLVDAVKEVSEALVPGHHRGRLPG